MLNKTELAVLGLALDDPKIMMPRKTEARLCLDMALSLDALEQSDRAETFIDRSLSLYPTAQNHRAKAWLCIRSERDWLAFKHATLSLLCNPLDRESWRLLWDTVFILSALSVADTCKAIAIFLGYQL